MKFEVFDSHGRRVFVTESEKCVPTVKELKTMAKCSGYKFKLDGKSYKPK